MSILILIHVAVLVVYVLVTHWLNCYLMLSVAIMIRSIIAANVILSLFVRQLISCNCSVLLLTSFMLYMDYSVFLYSGSIDNVPIVLSSEAVALWNDFAWFWPGPRVMHVANSA